MPAQGWFWLHASVHLGTWERFLKGSWKDDGFQQNLGHDWLREKSHITKSIYLKFFFWFGDQVSALHIGLWDSLALPGCFMGGALWLLWIGGSFVFQLFGEVGGTVVAQKSKSKALISSSCIPRVFLEAVVQTQSVENCNTFTTSSRFQPTEQGLAQSGWTGSFSNHEHELDMPILQSSFASPYISLHSVHETLETSTSDEQIEEPESKRQESRSIQADDTETKFEGWSTRGD